MSDGRKAEFGSWRIVVDNRRSPEDFDYWEFYDSMDLWYYVFNPIYSREKKSIKRVEGALFISEKYIIF